MFDDEVNDENKSKEGGFKIDIGGAENESNKNHKFFTGMNLKTPDFRNKKVLTIGFMCICILLVFISAVMYFHSQSVKKENLKNLNTVSTASPDVLNKQHIRDSIKSLQPYEDKLMNNVVEKNKKTNLFNKSQIGINDYLNDLDNYKKSINEKLTDLQKVSCAAETNTYKNNVIKEHQIFSNGLNHEISYINGKLNGKSDVEMSVSQNDYKQLIELYKENSNELSKIQNMCK